MTTADLTKYIRARLGKIQNNIDIDDNDISHAADIIIKLLGEKFPKRVLRSVTLTEDTREYTVENGTIRVPEVFTNSEMAEMNMDLGSPLVAEVDVHEDYNFPSLWAIKQMRRRRAAGILRFDFNPIEKKLKIDPTAPLVTGDKLWYMSVESAGWALATIPTDFNELVELGSSWKCLEIVAMRRSTEGGILREGGTVAYPADAIFRIARDMKKEFDELLDIKMKLFF